jgi:hypothetical protein
MIALQALRGDLKLDSEFLAYLSDEFCKRFE